MKETIKTKPKRASLRAYSVANEVVNAVRQNKKINMQEVQIRHGYTPQSAKSMAATRTQTYRDTVAPVIEQMKRIHQKALQNIEERDFTDERLDSVVNVARQVVHDTQLLQGRSTENVATNVVVYGSDDFLSIQANGDSMAK